MFQAHSNIISFKFLLLRKLPFHSSQIDSPSKETKTFPPPLLFFVLKPEKYIS